MTTDQSQSPGFYRYRLGEFRVVALADGAITRDRPANFIANAEPDAVGAAFAEAGMPLDKLTLTFNPLAVETPSGVVLIDAGFGDSGPPTTGRLVGNLRGAGIAPEDVGTIIISHFHADHVLGLRRQDGTPIYPNATLLVPQPEVDYWLDQARRDAAPEAARANFDLARKTFDGLTYRTFHWGDEILPGFTAVQADGHTPGMTAIEISSGNDRLLYVADVTNNPVIFARHPEWQAMFDVDPARTIATRRRIFDRAAAERLRLHFFHAPFPATGYVVKQGDAYAYLPAMWNSDA